MMTEHLIKLIEAASKAPSGHNTQPWLFKAEGDSIFIFPNMDNVLSIVDKDNRELFISLGAATENLCIEAKRLGYSTSVEINESTKSIEIRLYPDCNIDKDTLATQIQNRQTNRSIYNNRSIPASIISRLKQVPCSDTTNVYIIGKENKLFGVLRSYVKQGNEIQMNDDSFRKELLEYMRFNKKELEKNPTGLSYKIIGAPALPAFISKPIVKLFLKPDTQNKGDMKKIDSSSHFVLFTIANNSLKEWVNVGCDLERFILSATQLGISNAYMNQPCEVAELSEHMRQNITLIKGEYPTLLLRIGYAEPAPYSTRKKIDDIMIK